MRLVFDHQIFALQAFGGISRYYTELIRRLQRTEEAILPFHFYANKYFHELPQSSGKFHVGLTFKGRARLLNELGKPEVSSRLKKNNFDLFVPTYYDDYFLQRLRRPFVVTVYDAIHELFPSYFTANDPIVRKKKNLLRAAQRIVSISENTKKDIVDIYGIPESKVEVVPLGIDPVPVDFRAENPLPGKRFILFVGNRGGYKNFDQMLRGIRSILRSENFHLVAFGGPPFSAEERALFHDLEVIERVHHFRGDDVLLASFYRYASVFCFPSLYEGFGLPLLEAMYYGCPVCCSDRSSFPEVGGDSVAFFDPSDPTAIERSVLSVLQDGTRRQMLIERGKKRVGAFSWDTVSANTLKVFQSVV